MFADDNFFSVSFLASFASSFLKSLIENMINGSGPIGSEDAPFFAALSAASFPGMPMLYVSLNFLDFDYVFYSSTV